MPLAIVDDHYCVNNKKTEGVEVACAEKLLSAIMNLSVLCGFCTCGGCLWRVLAVVVSFAKHG